MSYLRAYILGVLLITIVVAQGCSAKADEPKPVKPPADNSFSVANVLQSNMVVQRDKPLVVWGKAKAGLTVNISVSWNTEKFSATADNLGNWKGVIPASPANSNPQTIAITAGGTDAVTLSNILIGDVWICSGQSNMVMPLAPGYGGSFAGVTNYEREIVAANYPLIRELTIKRDEQPFPADSLSNTPAWNVCSPATAGNISAVAYYFAQKLHTELNVPVGIIIAAVNGTNCQQWANAGVFADGEISAMYGGGAGASMLYNGMINPLINLGIKGFIWYQGENNWGDDPLSYAKLSAELIKGWRAKFNSDNLPFYYTQLTPFAKDQNTLPGGGDLTLYDYALFREGQKEIVNLAPKTGMAVTMDVGNVLLIHPPEKKPVGERLALLALKNDYGKPVNPFCPRYKSHTQSGNLITITFDNAEGLKTKAGQPLKQLFYVADDGRVLVNANAVIQGNTIVLTVPDGVGTVKSIRYAFTNAAVTNLQNNAGLPVQQFRTDNW